MGPQNLGQARISLAPSAHSGRTWHGGRGVGGGVAVFRGPERIASDSRSSESGWAECANATRQFDMEMVGSLRGDMDTLLVFASLFSAVVTAFVIVSYPGLIAGTSSGDTTAALLQQFLLHMNEKIDAPMIRMETSTSSAPSTSSICINALWFSSLTLSLNTVLGAILAKQWLSEYELVTCSTQKSPREQVPLRQLKFDSLGRWRVPTIIEYLPVQLILALFLFFAGLVYFVWTLNPTVAIITSFWVGVFALAFLATTLLPSFFDLCAFCSPQSWFFFYLSKKLHSVFSPQPASDVYSFTDTWIDAFMNALSRPVEARLYSIRAFNWIDTFLVPWESSLTPSLYRCVDTLPQNDAAEAVCGFWRNATSPNFTIMQRQIYASELWTAIGQKMYWRIYSSLLESLQLQKGQPNMGESHIIVVFCSLHLVLCAHSPSDEADEILLKGLTQIATALLDPSIPLDTRRSATAILSHIGSQANIHLPYISGEPAGLYLFTETLIPDHMQQHTAEFLSLSMICIRLWSSMEVQARRTIDLKPLTRLLSAMQGTVRGCESSVGAAITQWMMSAIDRTFARWIVDETDKDALAALQAFLLCCRKAYDDGIRLADDVVEHIDVLIVSVCPPEAVCAALSGTTHRGANGPFSEANMEWWADKLSEDKARVFRLLCEQSPPLNPSVAPNAVQALHVRVIFEAACFWREPWYGGYLFEALPLLVNCCTLSESDLSLWFPGMASPNIYLATVYEAIVKHTETDFNDEDRQKLGRVMCCAVHKLPRAASDDSNLFLSLVSGSLSLVARDELNSVKLRTEVSDLLGAAAAFVQLHNAHDAHAHTTTIRQWVIHLTKLKVSKSSPTARLLIHAVRDGGSVAGLSDVNDLDQLRQWERRSHNGNTEEDESEKDESEEDESE